MHKLLKQLTHPTGKFWVFLEIKIERTHMHAILKFLAEAVRFELTNGCPLPVFKTGAIDHSATPPGG